MKPAALLRTYCAVTFAIGTVLTAPVAYLIHTKDLEMNAGVFLALSWNILFVMILPLILDWSERKYARARFIALEELAETNPELKAALDAQCEKLALPGLRLAVADTAGDETFSYGLFRNNPRLIVPATALSEVEKAKIIPSIELELARFKRQDSTPLFLLFAALQIGLQFLIVRMLG
jgi:hypothetical protein